MNNKQKAVILGTGVLCGVISAVLLFFGLSLGKSENSPTTASSSSVSQKEKQQISSLNQQLQEAEQALKNLKDGNNEQVLSELQDKAQKLFDVYYNYTQNKSTNEKRQGEVKDLVTPDVAAQLFPLSADQQHSDYGAIQSRLNEVQVFTQNQTGEGISALVDCHYTVQAGEMTSSVPHYLFQVLYEPASGRITKVTELGKAGQ